MRASAERQRAKKNERGNLPSNAGNKSASNATRNNASSWGPNGKRSRRRAPSRPYMLADVFDFADPNLWKSNSFAALRPRLVIHVRAVFAKLEYELADAVDSASKQPFSMYADKEQRRLQRADRQRWAAEKCRQIEAKLDRAREISALLDTVGDAP
jgi:hypothetical protein